MSSQAPVIDAIPNEQAFEKVSPDWKWKPGNIYRLKTPVPADEYTLTVDHPQTFEELQKLVDNIIVPKRKDLFQFWFAELKKRGLIDLDSFKQAVEKEKAKSNGNT